jgi:hypothetical protein
VGGAGRAGGAGRGDITGTSRGAGRGRDSVGIEAGRSVGGRAGGGRSQGVLQKNIGHGRGWRTVKCKLTPALSAAIRSRSGGFDRSFHSLHKCRGQP